MTALSLLAYISAALLFQLVAGLGVAFGRRRAIFVAVPAGPQEPATIAAVSAWSGLRDFRVARREYEGATNTQCSFYLQPVDGVALARFNPGQYLTFQLPVSDRPRGAAVQNRTITRCYSLSDQPDGKSFRITVKRALPPVSRPELPAGAASTYLHDHVHEGDVVRVQAPAGRFFIDPDASVPAVLIAGGIGVTPMMSMLNWCLAEQPSRAVHLYYGVRNRGDHAFKSHLEQLAGSHPNFHLSVLYVQPDSADVLGRDYQHAGYVNVDLLRRTLPHGRHQFYVCGPAAMMETLVPAIIDWGVPATDVHFEAFGPATVRATLVAPVQSAAAVGVAVQFLRSGRTLAWDGADASLLDFAEKNGVVVEAGCRAGSCGSCDTELVSGTVRYANTPDFKVASGHCLLCVGMPESALVLKA